MVLHVDGSVVTNLGQSGFGGLLRDHERNFHFDFYWSIGLSNVLYVEIASSLNWYKIVLAN